MKEKCCPRLIEVITIIEEARDRVISLGINPDKITHGLEYLNYENLNIREGVKNKDFFTIFYGGAINRHRGLQLVLEAVRICVLKNMKVRLWIVGDGSYRKKLEKITGQMNLISVSM